MVESTVLGTVLYCVSVNVYKEEMRNNSATQCIADLISRQYCTYFQCSSQFESIQKNVPSIKKKVPCQKWRYSRFLYLLTVYLVSTFRLCCTYRYRIRQLTLIRIGWLPCASVHRPSCEFRTIVPRY